jgi:beta-lactam-binding protein with PASTA domain
VVPRLAGRSVASATAVLAERGLRLAVGGTTVSPAPRGSIVAQFPAASRRVSSASTVSVTLSDGPAQPTIEQVEPPVQGKPKSKPARDHGHGHGHRKRDKGHKGT